VVTCEDGLVRDILGDHRLAKALGGDEDAVAAGGEEVETERGLDGGAVDPREPRPVKGRPGGDAPEAAAEQAAIEAAAGAFLLLDVGEMLEELGGTPAAFGGEGDEVVQVLGGVIRAEKLEASGSEAIGHLLLRGRGRREQAIVVGQLPGCTTTTATAPIVASMAPPQSPACRPDTIWSESTSN
jgi:hypothetical protein